MTDTKLNLPPIILLLGPPGVGKSSLCTALSEKIRLYHLSVGEFCRALNRGEDLPGVDNFPDEAKKCLKESTTIPGELLVHMIRGHLSAVSDRNEHDVIIVDGFPRSQNQQLYFEQGMPPPVLALSLQCPEEVRRSRYLGRNDPSRPGEDAALFKLRTESHFKYSAPIEEFYEKKDILVKVDVSGDVQRYIDDVSSQIKRVIELEN